MRKKVFFALTVATMGLALAACGKDDRTNGSNSSETVEQDETENTAIENSETENTMEENTEESTMENDGMTEEEVSGEANGENTGAVEDATGATGCVEILNDVWAAYGEEEKFFAIGGDMNNPVENAPGAYSMEDAETLSYALAIPAESVALVDEVATLIHAMNANTFTGAAFHLADSANAEMFATALKDNMQNTQWMCGIPEKVIMIHVNEEYVISAFGNGEVIDTFKNKVMDVYGENAVLMIEEAIQ